MGDEHPHICCARSIALLLYIISADLSACHLLWFCSQFQSHQIFHMFVLAGAFVHLHGSSVIASHRLSFGDSCEELIKWWFNLDRQLLLEWYSCYVYIRVRRLIVYTFCARVLATTQLEVSKLLVICIPLFLYVCSFFGCVKYLLLIFFLQCIGSSERMIWWVILSRHVLYCTSFVNDVKCIYLCIYCSEQWYVLMMSDHYSIHMVTCCVQKLNKILFKLLP